MLFIVRVERIYDLGSKFGNYFRTISQSSLKTFYLGVSLVLIRLLLVCVTHWFNWLIGVGAHYLKRTTM